MEHLQMHIPQLKNSACVEADELKLVVQPYETYESPPRTAKPKLPPLLRRIKTPTFCI
jgi:hypothetical protein